MRTCQYVHMTFNQFATVIYTRIRASMNNHEREETNDFPIMSKLIFIPVCTRGTDQRSASLSVPLESGTFTDNAHVGTSMVAERVSSWKGTSSRRRLNGTIRRSLMIPRAACSPRAQVPACFFDLFDMEVGLVCCVILLMSIDRVTRRSAQVPGEFNLLK